MSLLFNMLSRMDRDAWHAVIHGVAKSQTRLSELNQTDIYIYILSGDILGLENGIALDCQCL